MRGILENWSSWRTTTNEHHIERVRRNLAVFDRWRRPLTALYLGLMVILIGLFVSVGVLLERLELLFGNQARGLGPGFIVGLGLGSMLGMLVVKTAHGLVDILLGYRNERLLIDYYDALREAYPDAVETAEPPDLTAED